jgi:hypothetical protein
MSKKREGALPDDAPDRGHEFAQGPDDPHFWNPASISAFGKVQQLEQELTKERALKEAYKSEYGIEETDEQLAGRLVDAEVDRETEYLVSEEGQQALKQGIMEHWAKAGPDPQADSDASFKETYSQRLEREAREAEESKE